MDISTTFEIVNLSSTGTNTSSPIATLSAFLKIIYQTFNNFNQFCYSLWHLTSPVLSPTKRFLFNPLITFGIFRHICQFICQDYFMIAKMHLVAHQLHCTESESITLSGIQIFLNSYVNFTKAFSI